MNSTTPMIDSIASVGDRVQLHPGLDAWMQGDKYGDVAKVTHQNYHVKMDRSGRTLLIPRQALLTLVN